MPAPDPLTPTPPALLTWSAIGEPVAQEYDDVYFSVDGGLAETRAVFLHGSHLPEAWTDKEVFVIGELGFGTGLNFLAAWNLWEQTAKSGQCLHFISVEATPLSKEQLTLALENFPSLKPYANQLISQWPGRVKGVHRLHFGTVTLTLFHDYVEQALSNFDGLVNAWFLDGFSPAKNPDMWSKNVFELMARHSVSTASVATFTVAGHVRRGLGQAGFLVEKKPGFGRKRERLEARYTGVNLQHKSSDTPVIIGGGIAGASIATAFTRRGITPIIIEPHKELETAASGNPAGLVMPKLDLQDRPESRFYNAAYLYALNLYREADTILGAGVLQIATSEKERERYKKIVANQALPDVHMQWVSSKQAQQILGENLTTKYGGLHFPSALTIAPKNSARALCKHCTYIQERVAKIHTEKGRWQILGKAGKILAKTDNLFICNGANILDLWPADVRFTRGQICWGDSAKTNHALIAGNYAVPFQKGMLLGATHSHTGAGENTKTKTADTVEIIKQYEAITAQNIDGSNWQSRAAVRVTTRNTLPVAHSPENGLFVLSGLGSRGLMMSPLLGEFLVCKALGEPAPLDIGTQARFLQVR